MERLPAGRPLPTRPSGRAEGLGCGGGHGVCGARQGACAPAAPVRSRPAPGHSALLSLGKVHPRFTSSSGSLPPNSSSVTPLRRTLYPSGGPERTGDAVTAGVPGRGGRRSLPPDSQRTRSLPLPRAPRIQRADPVGPHPHPPERVTSGRRGAAVARTTGGVRRGWRVGEEALSSRDRPRSGSRSLWR